jgi:LacI family transcriptional regulator
MQGMVEFRMEHHPDYLIQREGKEFPVKAVEEMLLRPAEDRPTALILDSQGVLFQMLKWFRKYRISIPDDMSLIVYDDVPEMQELLDVPLTVVGPGITRLASSAIEILAGELGPKGGPEQPQGPSRANIVIEPDLVIRESSRPIRS